MDETAYRMAAVDLLRGGLTYRVARDLRGRRRPWRYPREVGL